MDGIDITLRIVGAFYTFAGLVAARAALTSNLIDQAISAISLSKPDPIDTHRTIWLVSLSILIFIGGILLMLLLEPAAWIFAAGTLVQALYFLVLGPLYFDVADPPDPAGRRRSINAFVIYCAATAFVVWAAYTGRLIPLANASGIILGVAAAAIVLHIGYILRHMLWAPKRQPSFSGFGDDMEPDTATYDDTGPDFAGLPASSRRFKLMADYGTLPLWAMDEGLIGDFAPQDLGVSEKLTADLWTWANELEASLNPDDPANSRWSADRHRQHVEEGIALARRIKRELPDREVFVHDASGALVEVTSEDAAKS